MNSKNFYFIGVIVVVVIVILASFSILFMTGNKDNINNNDNEITNKNLITSDFLPVTSGSVEFNGNIISVSDSSNPLSGLIIDIPQAATDESIDFAISYSDVLEATGLPEKASVAGKMIKIETDGSTDWNKYKTFDKAIEVTLPYDSSLVSSNETVRYYIYDEESNMLSSTGFIAQDTLNHTISFLTRTFSSFVAVKLSLADHEYFGNNFSVDTDFRPKTDGFYIPNEGSYLRSGGICMGMVSFARFYYMYKKGLDGIGAYEKYREGDKNEWRDDETAIQLATRAQMAEDQVWNQIWNKELIKKIPNSLDVGISWIHGMIVTGSPQLIGIYQQLANGKWTAGHAILAYKYENGRFDIYDPNYPGTEPGTDARQIPFTYNNGFTRSYSSGISTGTGNIQYNIFLHWGYETFHPYNAFNQLYYSAQNKFQDDSIFPTITLTDYNSEGTTPIDTDGDGIRDTTELRTTISGTITGGKKDVKSTLIFISNQKFKTPVDSHGKFSQEVPLFAGKNDLIILGTDEDTFSNK